MHFKLIITFLGGCKTERVMEAARKAGAAGATIISSVRGEGMNKVAIFLIPFLETQRMSSCCWWKNIFPQPLWKQLRNRPV